MFIMSVVQERGAIDRPSSVHACTIASYLLPSYCSLAVLNIFIGWRMKTVSDKVCKAPAKPK